MAEHGAVGRDAGAAAKPAESLVGGATPDTVMDSKNPFVPVALVIGLLLLAVPAQGQRVVDTKGLKFADYFDPPHETQMKWLLEGAKPSPWKGGEY